MLKKIIKLSSLLFLMLMCVGCFQSNVHAASSPYDVESTVKTNWDKIYGAKTFQMATGKALVYDIYSEKYNSNGYSIITKDFGKGSQKYIRFQGWSILFGHYRHTSSNHETYIVAEDVSNINNVKIYGTLPYGNLSATEDVEYGKANSTDSTVYAECGATVTNRTNYVPDGGCNMRYDNVGFDAYLPIEELFSDISKAKNWNLYIVKRVNSHIVYSPLYIPFDFNTLAYEGGDISLSSGVNARQLRMNSSNVLARSTPRGSTSLGYFTVDSQYTAIDQNESGTAIWYGVKFGSNTGWTSSPYWNFGGSQARLSFTPDNKPPEHISDNLVGTYQNGKITWVQPNQAATATLRQRDVDSGNKYQYIKFSDSSVDVRSRHDFENSSTTHKDDTFTNSIVKVNSAKRTENTTYGTAQWTVTPTLHGKSYDMSYYYVDRAGKTLGYVDTGRDLKVDGNAPTNSKSTITGASYVNGEDYWVQSGKPLKITLSQLDSHSGNKHQFIRLIDNSGTVVARYKHEFANSSDTSKVDELIDANVTVTSKRTSNTTTGTLEWTITPKKHGETYKVQYFYRDNVNNQLSAYMTVGTIKVDGQKPVHIADTLVGTYQNGLTTWVQPNQTATATLRQRDVDSGNKYQYIKFSDSTVDVRSRHDFENSSITHKDDTYINSVVKVNSTKRTENTTYGAAEWTVTPTQHGKSYDMSYYYVDRLGNTLGYVDTGRDLKVDGNAPINSKSTITGASYVDGTTYWAKPSSSIKITLSQSDVDSGNEVQYLRLIDSSGNIIVRSYHQFSDSSNSAKVDEVTNANVAITAANRTSNTTTGTIDWTVLPKKDGETYTVQYYYRDNVKNNTGYITIGTITVDDPPPNHIEDTMTGTYQKDKVTWVKPNETATITLRQQDLGSGNKLQYVGLDDDTTNVRSSHDFTSSSTTNKTDAVTASHITIDSAKRLENTTYGKVEWKATPTVHGKSYNLKYYYTDNSGNSIGYNDTSRDLKVDGIAPTHTTVSITGAAHVQGSTYWVNSNTPLKVVYSQNDPDSGNKSQYLRLVDRANEEVAARSVHNFNQVATTKTDETTSANVVINSAKRTSNTAEGTVEWTVTPKKHGTSYKVQYQYWDNVENGRGHTTTSNISVDDVAPTVAIRNAGDTADFKTAPTPVESINVRLKFADADSGYQKSRYGWSNSATQAPATWSNWSTSNDYIVEQTKSGKWYLHIEAMDKVGNTTGLKADGTANIQGGVYIVNTAPKVVITMADVHYIGDTIHVINDSYDVDGDELTYTYLVTRPDGTVELINHDDPRIDENGDLFIKADRHPADLGTWMFTLEAADPIDVSTATISTEVLDQTVFGKVTHTEQWLKNIEKFNIRYPSKALNLDDSVKPIDFIAGERFVLNANAHSNAVNIEVLIKEYTTRFDKAFLQFVENTIWNGDLWNEKMVEIFKDNEELTFEFTATFSNGWIDVYEVKVRIKDEAYWKQHTSY